LLYGHMDKQPPMNGQWLEGLDACKPVIRGDKLYGRGGADDGYAVFAAIMAIKAMKAQSIPHARCVLLIEGCEESGSLDLPYYIDALSTEIGKPSLVVCLDSGCGNYEQLWLTGSLRGLLQVSLKVQILEEGVHSGSASGIVPSSFRIIRQLLDRIEDSATGKVLAPECWASIPEEHSKYTQQVAKVLGADAKKFPLVKGARRVVDDPVEYILNSTWRPTISYTGVDGVPPMSNAGNVLRPSTTFMLSIRLPPTVEPDKAYEGIKRLLEKDVPYGAHVTVGKVKGGKGFVAPKLADWLDKSLSSSCKTHFSKPYLCWGEGGSIPFMGMLAEKFPGTQFVITGVLGPESNAHGPNEFLHIPMTKRLTCCVSEVLADHYIQFHSNKKRKLSVSS